MPGEHLVDMGYTDTEIMAQSHKSFGVDVVGPIAKNPSWQTREEGFDKDQFTVDWEAQTVTCPAGKQAIRWYDYRDVGMDESRWTNTGMA